MANTAPRIAVTDKLLAFAFGVAFLIVILVIAVLQPNPSGFSYTVFRIVLALAAGGVGAVLPGFIQVSFRNALRAGGAVALFVIVYFFAPAPIEQITKPNPPPPTAAARPVAEHFLKMLDSGDHKAAYESMATSFKARYAQSDMQELVEAERKVLGPVVSRKFDATGMAIDPPGADKGHHISFGYRTRFANEPRTIFEAVSVYAEDGQWKPTGFFTSVKAPNGQFVSYDPDDTPVGASASTSPSPSAQQPVPPPGPTTAPN